MKIKQTCIVLGINRRLAPVGDYTNSYDNAMVVRYINWTSKRYKIGTNGKLSKTLYSLQNLSKASNGVIIK